MSAEERDDLTIFLEEQLKDPAFASAFEDAGVRPRLALRLIELRRAAGLSVEDVAARMEVKPKAVLAYERGQVDPYLSFAQRYARAVGGRLRVDVELPPP